VTLGRAAAALAAGAVCVVVALHARSGYLYHSTRGDARPGPGFNPHTLPVRAAEFLNRGDVPEGRLLNALHDGGYLGFATRRRVFIDGRLELGGPEWFQAHMATVHPDRLGATMVKYDLQFAVVPYADVPSWFLAFAAQDAWRCVHLDDYSAVFFRADFAPSIPAVSPRASGAPVPDGDEERLTLRRGTGMRNPGPLESLRRPHYYPLPEIRLCRAYQELGHAAAAVAVGLEGLRRTTFDAPDLLLNLGSAYWRLGRREQAAVCYRAWLTPRRGHRPNATTRALILARLKQTDFERNASVRQTDSPHDSRHQ
jgi:tetratricopeptide (TPR) repeat protein